MTVFFPLEYKQALHKHFKLLAREIKNRLKEQYDVVIGITGYPGVGKSTLAIILGTLTDSRYDLKKNICFVPTSKAIEEKYNELPQCSILHIDEASRGLHKHKWQDKVQQKLNELFDTERENHYLCTLLLMPRFQNFTENFRNFRINIWINIIARGIAIVYKRDEDKDCKDPWHIEENYKLKMKKFWKGRKVYERNPYDIITIESRTVNYWFYFTFPDVPEDIGTEYRELKADSRIKDDETDVEIETYNERRKRIREERFKVIRQCLKEGYSKVQIAMRLGVSETTIRQHIREIEAKDEFELMQKTKNGTNKNIIFNQIDNPKNPLDKGGSDKELFVSQDNAEMDQILYGDKKNETLADPKAE